MKKMKYITPFLVIVMLMGVPLLGFLQITTTPIQIIVDQHKPVMASAWQEGTLEIGSNADLEINNMILGADGTAGNPYVIANLTINATRNFGIYIHDTTAHFILRNCTVINASNGIYLEDVINGKLYNNTISQNTASADYLGNGIFLYFHCYNNTLINNTVHASTGGGSRWAGNGICLYYYCTNNTLFNNTLSTSIGSDYTSGNGILLETYCNNNTLTSNTIFNNTGRGILLDYYCNNATLSDNTISQNTGGGIYLTDSCNNHTLTDNTIFNNTGGGILLSASSNYNTLSDNIIFNNLGSTGQSGNGIQLIGSSNNNTLTGNTIYNNTGIASNSGNGIFLDSSCNYNNITGNIIKNNTGTALFSGNGIVFNWYSSYNTITGNTISNNTGSQITAGNGIYLFGYCIGNTIYNNTISNNTGSVSQSGNGIYLQSSCTDNKLIDNAIFNNTGIDFYSGNGILLYQSDGNELTNNSANYNTQNGIGTWNSHNNKLFNNTANNNTQYGILLQNSNNNLIMYTIARGNLLGIKEIQCSVNIIPIFISQDKDFETYCGTGTGIVGNPYVIANYSVDIEGLEVHGAWIQDTTACFILKNCTIINADTGYSGLFLSNVQNANITNNTINNNAEYGIYLENSQNCNITWNIFQGNGKFPCIYNTSCTNLIIENNECKPRGPELAPISPSIDIDGINIWLNWTYVSWADLYYTYIDNNPITQETIAGLDPEPPVSTNFTMIDLSLSGNGLYYVVIVATNTTVNVNSTISNCENVSVEIPLSTPTLEVIAPRPNTNGSVFLNWSVVPTTTGIMIYSIYRNTSLITSLAGQIVLNTTTSTTYIDNITTNGIYYYVIVASDGYISQMGNCENISVEMPLSTPTLEVITPRPNTNGSVFLNWSVVATTTGIMIYSIYRNTTLITSLAGQIVLNTTTSTTYIDNITTNGIYYYVIVASDGYINQMGNCENISVLVSTNTPILSVITPNPSTNGSIFLNWTAVDGATIYYIYRNTSKITSIETLIPINSTANNNYTDEVNAGGIYHYIIVASDGWVNGSISNCQNVTVILVVNIFNLPPYESTSIQVLGSTGEVVLSVTVEVNVTLQLNITIHETIPSGLTIPTYGLLYIEITSDIDTYELNATLRLYFDSTGLPDGLHPNNLNIYVYNEITSKWESLMANLNEIGGFFEVNLSHFSYYAIIGEKQIVQNPPPIPGFELFFGILALLALAAFVLRKQQFQKKI